mmetsp:Transcript_21936/g.64856  ORF Transcript_21936/g.64856 Transcript_21936/m.64856 type:complete len:450 (+) Transcript_21936:48-1397(+)
MRLLEGCTTLALALASSRPAYHHQSHGPTMSLLRGITDEKTLAETVADRVWGTSSAEGVTIEDTSGKGGGKVYIVSREDSEPATVVLKVKSEMSSQNLAADRMQGSMKALSDAGLIPEPIFEGDDYEITPFYGVSVESGRFLFDKEMAPRKAVAELLAAVHAVPADWYEPYRERTIARDERLSEVLGSAPKYSHLWNPFILGLENGILHLGTQWDATKGKNIMDMQIEAGTLQKLFQAECFHPVSAAGKRVVTVHGDFKADNIVFNKGEKKLLPIDFEATCGGPAVVDFGFMLVINGVFGSLWGNTYEDRCEFIKAYLEASGQPAGDDDVTALLLDIEVASITCCVGPLSNFWDAQVPLLRGSPHPTAGGSCEDTDGPTGSEVIDLFAEAIAQVRASPELVKAVVSNGMVKSLNAREVGPEELCNFINDIRNKDMLRLFGLAPDPPPEE